MPQTATPDCTDELNTLLSERILLLDGAMGVEIQKLGIGEADVRGERFAQHHKELKNFGDLLCLTRPDAILGIHRAYLEAGSDIIETNSFGASPVGMLDFDFSTAGLDPVALCREINTAAVRLAKQACEEFTERDPARPRFVAGSIGPTSKQMAISTRVDDPSHRDVTFNQMADSYYEQAHAMVDAGVDLLLAETVIDTLNLKACLFAIDRVFKDLGCRVPVMVSGTFDKGGGTFVSGQRVEAFWNSISHFPLFSVGMNCALGPDIMRPHLEELQRVANLPISCYPNAGEPNEMGEYDLGPAKMAPMIREFAEQGWVNIVGGCCGTNPEYIRRVADAVAGLTPRRIPEVPRVTALSDLNRLELRSEDSGFGIQDSGPVDQPATINDQRTAQFLLIGERTNVTGSRRFARLIKEDNFDEALAVARQQIENGANIIDVNMDEALLDGEASMQKFLWLIADNDAPDHSVPIMVDSSKWSVIEAGLKCLQGKGVVNSISLKEGEE
ncbi:MAG: homocysteine S-methyltransferase family protein, partial [Planctomycetales bacterium]|nr:homocysteine S-methyltransferase family protein [Planctomycetales bacterium]